MFYRSPRNHSSAVASTRAVLDGIAPGGGLYMPENLASIRVDWRDLQNLTTIEMAEKILSAFLPDFQDMAGIVTRAYTGKFSAEDMARRVMFFTLLYIMVKSKYLRVHSPFGEEKIRSAKPSLVH